MPQPFSPPQMLACQQRLASVLARIEPKPRCLVKLSSFGIDERSSKFVMVRGADKVAVPVCLSVGVFLPSFLPSSLRPSPTPFLSLYTHNTHFHNPPTTQKTQGPLGDAHRQGEAALCAAGIPWLVSLRPSSFFANFDAYDLPGLLAGEQVVRSPLGGWGWMGSGVCGCG